MAWHGWKMHVFRELSFFCLRVWTCAEEPVIHPVLLLRRLSVLSLSVLSCLFFFFSKLALLPFAPQSLTRPVSCDRLFGSVRSWDGDC